MPLSTVARQAVLSHFFLGVTQPSLSTLYVALFTTLPTPAVFGSEVSGGGYARQLVTLDAPDSAGNSRITDIVAFPVSTTSWGLILAFGLFDAATAGTFWAYEPLETPRFIGPGVRAWWQPSNLIVHIE